MKKILGLLVLVTLLVSCNNSIETKAIDQGKSALANKEYDKALASFELAIDEGTKDQEVKEIYDIIKKYKETKEFLDKGDIENSEKTLSEINSQYGKYSIKDDIDVLKDELEKQKNIVEEDKKEIVEEVTVQESKLIQQSIKNEYLQKFFDTQVKEDDIFENSLYGWQRATEGYELWDNLLNEIWSTLKQELPKDEMDSLTKIQVQWIKDKETEEQRIYDNGGNTSGAIGGSLVKTKERCKQLIDEYM